MEGKARAKREERRGRRGHSSYLFRRGTDREITGEEAGDLFALVGREWVGLVS